MFLLQYFLFFISNSTGYYSTRKPIETVWIDEIWNVAPREYKYKPIAFFMMPLPFEKGEVLKIWIKLLKGDYIARVFIVSEENFKRWERGESFYPLFDVKEISRIDGYAIKIPYEAPYYLIIYNDAWFTTIKVHVKIIAVKY